MIIRVRKRPVIVRAVQFTGDNWGEVRELTGEVNFRTVWPHDRPYNPEFTAEVWDRLHATWAGVKPGQWVIEGLAGEFYPHDEDLFWRVYDKVEE